VLHNTTLPAIYLQKQSEEMIRRRGERVTPARIQILAILLGECQAITHQEIEERLREKHRLDRVTLYRVLEWLSEKGFVHKVVSEDRTWRFLANTEEHPGQHAHFECLGCTRVVCLEDFEAVYEHPLPVGYHFWEIELTVKGLCDECA
jgi:Fur family ferric uptake transcriptional regulator